MKRLLIVHLLIILTIGILKAQSDIWSDISESRITLVGERYIVPASYRTLTINLNSMRSLLKSAPMELTENAKEGKSIIVLPLPDGTFQKFKFWESPAMEPELQAKYPEIRTYSGQGIDDPYASVKFDLTPEGFHAQILSPDGRVFIDPYDKGDINNYICYYAKDYNKVNSEFECQVFYHDEYSIPEPDYLAKLLLPPSGPQLRTYRLANAATGEYTIFHGGTVALGLAAVTTSINRVNGVYEKEVAVRMVLVANNNLIIYTNPSTDPYTNNNGSVMLSQNISNLNSVIGSSNYDIGHVFSTGGGGVAYLGCVCTSNKAGGVTGSPSPIGDPFDIDYVAHEMGHQFGGNHSFNGNSGSCAGNRNASTAYEPGSGSTIMGYAGICAPQDLQDHSDAYFHVISFDEIRAYTTTGSGNSCAVITNTGNNAPVVTVPPGGFYIPKSTPFSLTGSATDPNGDPVTYCWEEFDLGPEGDPNSPSGNAPILRSFTPVTSTTRIFPKLSNLLNNTSTIGEILPTYGRNLTFRLTVRDNRAGGGGVDWHQVAFNVDGNSGPFVVTSPNTNVSWLGNTEHTITWNTANTNFSPVNCANVKILLSTNGGNNFSTVLSSSSPNDGSELITLPNLPTSQARIRVEAINNVFFDISNVNFTIVNNPVINDPVSFNSEAISSSQNDLSFTPNANNNNVVIVWNYIGTFTTPTGSPPSIGGPFAGGSLLYNGISSPVSHTGLTQATTYFYKAFSYDGIDYSPGLTANARTFYAVPYSQTFDDPAFPPTDWSLINAGAGNMWERNTNDPYAGAGDMIYSYNATQPANAWAFTPGFYLESGRKYFISFYQKVLSPDHPEKLKVTIGNAPEVAAQTITLWDNAGGSNLTNTDYELRTAEFNCTATGNYFFAFNCYSDANMRILFVDEISITPQPDIDLALTQFYQSSGLPFPRPEEDLTGNMVELNGEKLIGRGKILIELNNKSEGAKSSDENFTKIISDDKSFSLNRILSNIDITAEVTNLGVDPASFTLDWYVNGAPQTQYTGPTVDPGSGYFADLTFSPTERGTFNTVGLINVLNDENFNNNINSFRMRVYPDVYSRTIYDRGDNIVDSYFGWNNLTTPMKAGVRFTADSTIKLAGVDFIYRTETVTTGQIIVQIRAAGSSSDAPGSVLYTKIYNTSAYFPSGNTGDYIHFAFGDDAPVISSGSDYWITIKMPSGILYSGGTQGSGIILGRSFYEQNPDTTLWSSLIIGTDEYAWIMRSIQVASTNTTFQLSVPIADGWNMVSVPGVNTDGQGVSNWWSGHTGTVYKFVPGAGYSGITTTTPTEGYWMKNVGNNVYNTGDEWPAGGIQLATHNPVNTALGWNMFGGYEDIVDAAALTTTPPGQIVYPIYKFVPGTGYQTATQIVPGYGFWVKVSSTCQIIVPDVLAKGNQKIAEYFKDDLPDGKAGWGKITLTDASGSNYTLYVVTENPPDGEAGVDLNRYELPPPPPAGVFDIRFSTDRIAEDINNSVQSIEMQGVEYPVKIKVEGIDIRLYDVTGKILNLNINSGEEILVNNMQMNKLMISGSLIPEKYALQQNYPNPFNPVTTISFELPEKVNNAKLTIYNALGEKITELVNTSLEAGRYEYHWDAKNVATGIYIYELRTEKFVSVKKMLLLK